MRQVKRKLVVMGDSSTNCLSVYMERTPSSASLLALCG